MIASNRITRRYLLAMAALVTASCGFADAGRASTESRAVPAFAGTTPAAGAAPVSAKSEVAVLAGGCFWGVQGVYQHVKGVSSAVSGYAGGAKSTAVYEMVGSGATGHAESVQVTFDPSQISYAKILQIYFSVAHDPTEVNRQGPDSGTQYRSAIFPTDAGQAAVARAYITQLDGAHVFDAPIATRVEPDKSFYPAEEYHQDFLSRNPTYPYIVINDLPKIGQLKRLFPDLYRDDAVLVSMAHRN